MRSKIIRWCLSVALAVAVPLWLAGEASAESGCHKRGGGPSVGAPTR